MPLFTIWVDADSCPAPVRSHVITFCSKHQTAAVFVANRQLPLPQDAPDSVHMQVCPAEAQAADSYISDHVSQGDAVITKDIPFAASLVERDICVMNDRGKVFTKENIGERLSERDFSMNLAALGLTSGRSKSNYSQKDFKKFCDCFEREMQKLEITARYGTPHYSKG